MHGENFDTSVTPDANLDDTLTATSGGEDNSPAQDQPAPTMLDVVTQALSGSSETKSDTDDEGDQPEDDSASQAGHDTSADGSSEDEKSASDATGDDDLPDDPTDDELASFRRPVQKRVKKLLAQRNEARRALSDLEPDAASYRELRSFMGQNNLVDEDTRQLLAFGAHLRTGRLEEAFKLAAPFMQVVLEGTGRAIPQDLRSRVDNGEITDEMARQVARERYARLASEERAERTEQREQLREQGENDAAIRSAAANWEATTRRNDPDFDLKANAMREFAVALVARNGKPKTAAQATEYAQQAYQSATEFLTTARPKPKATRNAPTSGQSPNRAGAQPTPTSMEEAVFAALKVSARG